MSGNMIWRGRIDKQPHTVNLPVTGTLLPGTLVEDVAGVLTTLTTAMKKNFYVLGELDIIGRSVATAYADGETAIAYECEDHQVYQCRMAAATYAKGDALTIGASGRMTKASTISTVVVAYFSDDNLVASAGDLADCIIANAHTTAAA